MNTPPKIQVRFGNQHMMPTLEGALFWPEQDMLMVADLHLGKAKALAERGQLLPPYDTEATLASLQQVVTRFDPATVVCLGDNFHNDKQAALLSKKAQNTLAAMMAGRSWIWLTGNHDPARNILVGGEVMESLDVSPFHLAHHPLSSNAEAVAQGLNAVIAGHLHPCARVENRGKRLRRKCFAHARRQLILPAFGSYTGGLNVLDVAFGDMTQCTEFAAWLLGRDQLYVFEKSQLIAD